MKKVSKFLSERKGEKAHREAEAMGLKYKGFGYWVDPSSGEVTHKTEGDNLVAVEPDVETDKWKGDGAEQGGAMGPGGQMDKGGMAPMGNQQQAGFPIGSGQNVGPAGEPGAANVRKRLSWEPGPDGDTAVDGSEPPGDIPPDAFVGKTNYYQWVAGPDGTNFANLSYDNIKNTFESVLHENQGSLGLSGAGYQEPNPTNMAKERMKKVLGQKTATGRTDQEGAAAIAGMRNNPELQTVFGNQLAAMRKIANRDADRSYDSAPKDLSGKERVERNKDVDMWKKVAKLPAIKKDADGVAAMNQEARGLVKDPNFDLSVPNEESDAQGAFGQVWVKDDGTVVKQGDIGPGELAALHAMKDNPRFPTLLNAQFDGPFKHKSSEYNNPMGADNDARPEGQSEYWNPDEQSDFDNKFPTAPGTYAMTQAKGKPLSDAIYEMDDNMKDKVMRNFWRARGDLHKAGFSHNDMHGGNIYVDPETGEASIIDLGLAKDDPLSALLEGLGGADYEQGEDSQLSGLISGSRLPERMRKNFDKNRGDIEEMLMDNNLKALDDYDDYDADQDYSPTFQGQSDSINDMMRGGIRQTKERMQHLRDDLPFLQDPENVKKLIGMLYNEVGNSELADRMSDAFDKRQQDSRLIRSADKIRKRAGQGPINITNRNVVPPKNLDFDD